MSATENDPTLNFTEAGKRPFVATYIKKPVFCVGDEVYLLKSDGTREGPYIIASIPSTGKYTLSLENGEAVKNGEEVNADALEAE